MLKACIVTQYDHICNEDMGGQSCYTWKMHVYTWKLTSGGQVKNQGMWIVLDVTDEFRGHNVT